MPTLRFFSISFSRWNRNSSARSSSLRPSLNKALRREMNRVTDIGILKFTGRYLSLSGLLQMIWYHRIGLEVIQWAFPAVGLGLNLSATVHRVPLVSVNL